LNELRKELVCPSGILWLRTAVNESITKSTNSERSLEKRRNGDMNDLIFTIFGNVRDHQSLSPDLLPLIIFFAVTGGLILSKFTGSIGNLTLPINASALFIGAMGANWLTSSIKLPLDSTLEAPMVMSLVGMTVVSFLMLVYMQGDSVRR
jgi:hypothetical protein